MRRTSYPGQVVTTRMFSAILTFDLVVTARRFEAYVSKGRNAYATRDGRTVLFETADRTEYDGCMASMRRKGVSVN